MMFENELIWGIEVCYEDKMYHSIHSDLVMVLEINSTLYQKSGKRVLLIFKVHIMVYENIFQAVKVFYIVHSSINLSIKRFQAK